mmetsp:Transcript_16725/g.63324  ORF Transcript_16725/g.63324 Transcript_16725/m.63324 type:complete len:242 (-) Transcript_16725:3300-4025(-)
MGPAISRLRGETCLGAIARAVRGLSAVGRLGAVRWLRREGRRCLPGLRAADGHTALAGAAADGGAVGAAGGVPRRGGCRAGVAIGGLGAEPACGAEAVASKGRGGAAASGSAAGGCVPRTAGGSGADDRGRHGRSALPGRVAAAGRDQAPVARRCGRRWVGGHLGVEGPGRLGGGLVGRGGHGREAHVRLLLRRGVLARRHDDHARRRLDPAAGRGHAPWHHDHHLLLLRRRLLLLVAVVL